MTDHFLPRIYKIELKVIPPVLRKVMDLSEGNLQNRIERRNTPVRYYLHGPSPNLQNRIESYFYVPDPNGQYIAVNLQNRIER